MEPLETCRKVWERQAGENTRQEEWKRKEKPDEKREDKKRSSMNKDGKKPGQDNCLSLLALTDLGRLPGMSFVGA